MKFNAVLITIIFNSVINAQVAPRLETAYKKFAADPQLKNATSSLYVIDAKTGKVIFGKNQQVGLAPASTQKVITSVTAYELLKQDFRYQTEFSYDGDVRDSFLFGNLYVKASGDPTFGSFRFASTQPAVIARQLSDKLHALGIYKQRGSLNVITTDHDSQEIPSGWIWEDIGNYYGAGIGSLAWHENQYDLVLKPGKTAGDPVELVRTYPFINNEYINELKTGARNSGDNAYIYRGTGNTLSVKGTVPCCVDSFVIAGAAVNGTSFAADAITTILQEKRFKEANVSSHTNFITAAPTQLKPFLTISSPPFDSIIYWFNRKSINLYGEALVRSIAAAKSNQASTSKGVEIIKDFWKQQGLNEGELNLYDGSGLSPLNRVTTHAQVTVLKYARTKNWFPAFLHALPEYNKMKMKSGTISDVKGFCGYHTSKSGQEYIFSFLVNNYTGSSSTLVNKMYDVLNVLK